MDVMYIHRKALVVWINDDWNFFMVRFTVIVILDEYESSLNHCKKI